MEEFVTADEAAEIIGVTVGRVYQMLRAGELHGRQFHSRAWLVVKESAVEASKNPAAVGRPRSFTPHVATKNARNSRKK